MATTDDIITLVQVQLSSSASIVSDDGYESAVATALSELGWKLPNTNSDQLVWITRRALRHCLFILWIASAQKFKYKQVNLQHRFDHYKVLVEAMDKEYESAIESQANIFASVESYKLFGTALNAGFSYDSIGQDTTYDVSKFINSGD